MSAFRVAAAQYPIEEIDSFAAWEAKIARWLDGAKAGGAVLAAFPEYGGMELPRILGSEVAGDLRRSIEDPRLADLGERADAALARLAADRGLYVLGPSRPVLRDGLFRNAARLVAPSGRSEAVEKIVMTRFERESWGISAGGPLKVFDTALGRIGVAICYDVEFPLIGRALAEAGAEIILAPSCTDSAHGYWRVRVGAQARALENQCYVVQSPTVGLAPWSPAVDVNVGAAGVYGPPDRGFPADGVVSIGEMNAPGWVFADLDLDRVRQVRADGQVLNLTHWSEQATTAWSVPLR